MSLFAAITVGTTDATLLREQPTWSKPVSATFDLPANSSRGTTGPEDRTTYALRVRTRFKFTVPLLEGELPGFRTALQTLANGVVAVPFWPALCPDASYPLDAAYYLILHADGSSTVVALADRPDPLDDGDQIAPLLLGYFATTPEPELENGEAALCAIDFQEASPLTWMDASASFTAGPAVAGGLTPPLFPLRADWTRKPKAGGASVEITRQPLGARRELAEAYYTQEPVRPVECGFTTGSQAEWASLLACFRDRGATTQSLWLPAALNEARLTADVDAADTHLILDDTSALGGNRFLILDDGRHRTMVKATSAANPLPLSAAVGTDYPAAGTRVESLILARFTKPSLQIDFTTPELATATVAFRELPAEYGAVAGETIGVTSGALPTLALLYRFTLLYPGAPQVSRFSAFEFDQSDGTDTWLGMGIEHDEIREVLNLEEVATTIRSRTFAGNPLAQGNPFTLEFPLQVEIFEAGVVNADTLSDPATWRRLFIGECGTTEADGPFLKTTCSVLRTLAGRDLPRRIYGNRCPYTVYGPGCGLSRAAFEVAGKLNTAAAAVTTITVRKPSGSWSSGDYAAHYFAGGLISLGAGTGQLMRWIADSTAPDGFGIITLTLTLPLTGAVNAAVTLLPYCDGSYATCGSRFSNQAHFGGFPWMPVTGSLLVPRSGNLGDKK